MNASLGSIVDLMDSLTPQLAFAHRHFAPDLDSDALHNDCSEDCWQCSIDRRRNPMSYCKMANYPFNHNQLKLKIEL